MGVERNRLTEGREEMKYGDKKIVNGQPCKVVGVAPSAILVKFPNGQYKRIAR